MKITFWGVRGTLPTPDINKMKTGGNTTCVEVRIGTDMIIIFDAGTGIVNLGRKLLKEFPGQTMPPIYIFFTHTHWDHLQGFPFFNVLFCKGAQINIYGPIGKNRSLEDQILMQMDDDFCPISYQKLPSYIDYFEIGEEETLLPNNVQVTSKKHIHPGGAYSYRVEYDGKVFVFNTDTEHYVTRLDQRVVDISKDADLMVHDAQYTEDQMETHVGWGHSTWQQAVSVAKEANVKQLGFTHHDIEISDKEINALERKAKKAFENSFFCREGVTIEL